LLNFSLLKSHELQRRDRFTRAEIRSSRVRLTYNRRSPLAWAHRLSPITRAPSRIDSRHGTSVTLVQPGVRWVLCG